MDVLTAHEIHLTNLTVVPRSPRGELLFNYEISRKLNDFKYSAHLAQNKILK